MTKNDFSRHQPNPSDVVRDPGCHQIAHRHCDQRQRKTKHRAQQQGVRGQEHWYADYQCTGDLRAQP